MYKSIHIIALVLLLSLSVSCSKEYLDVENKNALTDGSFYQTQNDFWMALNSLYTPLAHGGLFGHQYQMMFGTFEDRILFESTSMDLLTFDPTFSNINTMFRDLYMGFYRTNMFIKRLNERQDVDGLTAEMREQYMGQARALRGIYYFYAVTTFDAPPFYDDLNMPDDINVAMSNGKQEDFWNRLEEDLTVAAELLPDTWGPEDAGRITSGAARAMLAKAMLYKHYHYYKRFGGSSTDDLKVAKSMFEQVIASGVYNLVLPKAPKAKEDYLYAILSNFSYVDLPAGDNLYKGENTIESVWEVQYNDEHQGTGWLPGWMWSGTLNSAYFSIHGSSYKNHEGHPDLWDEFEATDNGGTLANLGFAKDPRAYATFYIDGDPLEVRPESPNFGKVFTAAGNTKKVAQKRGLIPETGNTFPTGAFALKKYYFPVYYEKNAPNNDPVNRVVIRFADVLLMYAETCLLLGEDVDKGLAALNRVRARVDMPAVTTLNHAAIVHERDVELAFETLRWFDLIRWSFDETWGIDLQQILSRQTGPNGTDNFFVKGKHEYLPLPQSEIDLSRGAMKQNAGW
ncbi:MAG: RagB/SusD family nutrient uptake outer membrane protein [Prolixibacteraceae bacterium]|nr:RagB/SusD family nutrient uptake outer membrane protein [Prolixibacteraceae bacterium]